jgi:hypothetical protein
MREDAAVRYGCYDTVQAATAETCAATPDRVTGRCVPNSLTTPRRCFDGRSLPQSLPIPFGCMAPDTATPKSSAAAESSFATRLIGLLTLTFKFDWTYRGSL